MTDPSNQGWNRPADKVRAGMERDVQAVRDRRELSPEAKQARIGAVYLKAKTAMDAMNTADPAKRAADLAAAKRSLYGIDDMQARASHAEKAGMAMSFRDAQQRAGQATTSAQAGELLDMADQSGDELLARAVGNHAMSGLGMGDVAERYLSTRPAQAQAAEHLQSLSRTGTAAEIFEFVLPRPPELTHVSDGQAAALAAGPLANGR